MASRRFSNHPRLIDGGEFTENGKNGFRARVIKIWSDLSLGRVGLCLGVQPGKKIPIPIDFVPKNSDFGS